MFAFKKMLTHFFKSLFRKKSYIFKNVHYFKIDIFHAFCGKPIEKNKNKRWKKEKSKKNSGSACYSRFATREHLIFFLKLNLFLLGNYIYDKGPRNAVTEFTVR